MATLSAVIAPLGYEVIHVEVLNQRQKVLRVFIDFLVPAGASLEAPKGIGIEDCVRVTRALDEPLEALPEVAALFTGPYELEVSSPGIDRPLRRPQDFERFKGQDAQIHVFRPLTAEEMGNAAYCAKNPKQKHFQGELRGMVDQSIRIGIRADGSSRVTKGEPRNKKQGSRAANQIPVQEVLIPLALICKASLKESVTYVHESN